MGAHVWSFLPVAAVLIIVPGPDTALVTKNALLHGRRAALGTALGVNLGLVVWTLAAALGLAAVVRASAVAFTALKLVGAAYLIWLGVQALATARRHSATAVAGGAVRSRRLGGLAGFRQGLTSDLSNPKIAVLFTSLLPQFVAARSPTLMPFLLLGTIFVAMTLIWLCGYALVAVKASETLRRPSIAEAIERFTGIVLIGFGVRLATESR
ncbi:MAG TPA: LysE family translocator [Solirubrobacteraceae bacterium]|nr:LysE family translocator [Solirubrobacteraceae bacterium]